MIFFEPEMLASYNAGHTVQQVAAEFGISTGSMFKILRNNGCIFRNGGFGKGSNHSEESIAKIRAANLGKKLSEDIKTKISEAKKCHYNGMNGYGHTKPHRGGYILAYAPEHPNAHKDGYVMLHRILMERHIGRYLHDDEVVHHINHNRSDNHIDNLKLMNKSEHQRMHLNERKGGVALSIT